MQRFEWAMYDNAIEPDARLISSVQSMCSRYPSSLPPNSDGAVMPKRPKSPSLGQREW